MGGSLPTATNRDAADQVEQVDVQLDLENPTASSSIYSEVSMASNIVVPPGGFAGFSQMTPASRAALGGTRTRSGTRRRRKGSTSKRRTRARVKRSGSKRGGRKMKFGSPAWQRKYKVGKFRR